MTYKDLGYDGFLQRTLLRTPKMSPTEARNSIPAGSVSASNIIPPMNATTDIVFSSTDADTAAWTTGTIYFANGTNSGTIDSGNTGDISATTYVYYDRETLGALQTTTVVGNATGLNKLLVAIIEEGASGKDCKITPTIAAGLIVTGITAGQIAAGVITTDLLTVGSRSFTSTIAWTATDADTATWASGTIRTADGTDYSISAGNTGNIAAATFVYLDIDTSVTVLQTTTTASTAVGNNKLLVAIVTAGASGSKCVIDVISSTGTTISGNNITTGKVQSSDGKTYFDLDNDQIIMNDGSNDILLLGYQSGGF